MHLFPLILMFYIKTDKDNPPILFAQLAAQEYRTTFAVLFTTVVPNKSACWAHASVMKYDK